MWRLAGLRALVTGGERGYGAAIARELAAEGAAVAVHATVCRMEAEMVAAEIAGAGGRAIGLAGDLALQPEVEMVFGAAAEAFGGLDIVVNHAGMTEDELLAARRGEPVEASLLAIVLTTQEAARTFGRGGGSVINVSGRGTRAPVEVLTRSLARELRPRRIRVNAVHAGASAGDPGAVADAVVFLASAESGGLTGEELALTGGMRH